MPIRPFTPDGYAALTALANAVFPEHSLSESEMRHADETRSPKHHFGRFIAEENGSLVGAGEYDQMLFNYHPRKFIVQIMVAEDKRRRGIGGALYDTLMREIMPHDPLALRANARESRPESVAFLTKRGFVEQMRHWESNLDVTAFDPARFAADEEKARASGILVKTYADLKDEPEILPRLFDLTNAVGRDVPSMDDANDIDYEQWLKFFQMPQFLPEGTFIAIDGEDFVGFSNLFASADEKRLNTGLTGVRREQRGRGVATAMKLRAIAYAKRIGASVIHTSNESNNRAMLGINERLGFVKEPAQINFANALKEESAA